MVGLDAVTGRDERLLRAVVIISNVQRRFAVGGDIIRLDVGTEYGHTAKFLCCSIYKNYYKTQKLTLYYF
jgi:hypothetical protein